MPRRLVLITATPPIVIETPAADEASDGRVVADLSSRVTQVDVLLAGVPARFRIVSRRPRGAIVRLTLQVSSIARSGSDLELVAKDEKQILGDAAVPDVHLLGEGAFTPPATPVATASASQQARDIVQESTGKVGISAECLATGRKAQANAHYQAVAASTLKVAIVAASMARDRGSPTRDDIYPTYRQAIVDSNNDAANRVLEIVGGGSTDEGARRVNVLMAKLGMRDSYLDGPYRLTGGPSLKRTSASDLERLAMAVYLAARGSGPLARLGVSPHEARVLIGLMSSEVYPGLIRDHVSEPVAHKAGWLDTVQNDLVLVFDIRGGPCLIGITTEGLSFGEASAVGTEISDRVLPLLIAPVSSRVDQGAPAGSQSTSKGVLPPSPAARSSKVGDGKHASRVTWFAAAAVMALAAGALFWRWSVLARHRRYRPRSHRSSRHFR